MVSIRVILVIRHKFHDLAVTKASNRVQNFFINVVSDALFGQGKRCEGSRVSIRVSVVIRHKN